MSESIEAYLVQIGVWFVTSGLQIALIFILLAVGLKLCEVVAKKIFVTIAKKINPHYKNDSEDAEFEKRADTISELIKHGLSFSLISIAVIMILGELGIEIGPIMAAAGVVGVAVGFGAKNLVQDLISGFFLIVEDQVRVGDVVEISGKSGLVEKISLRMVILRDLSGNVHYVRNGEINVVTNKTKDYSRYLFEIGVAYRENVDEVIKIIKAVDEDLRNDSKYSDDILEPIEVLGLDKFADSALIIKARNKTKPIKQWDVAREFNRRLKIAFDEKGIEIPFPHLTLYPGVDKEGKAPSLKLQVDKDDFSSSEEKKSSSHNQQVEKKEEVLC